MRHINRIHNQRPKRSPLTWCQGCDSTLVRDGKKCSRCGLRFKRRLCKRIEEDVNETVELALEKLIFDDINK